MKRIILVVTMLVLSNLGWTEVQFSKKKIKLGSKSILVEVADTQEKAAHGLMYRNSLPENEGMLFIFPQEETRNFWMKNTFIPLSIGFFDKKKKLIDVQEMLPVTSEMQKNIPTYQSKGPAQYVLEMPAGWFEKNKIKIGTKINLDK